MYTAVQTVQYPSGCNSSSISPECKPQGLSYSRMHRRTYITVPLARPVEIKECWVDGYGGCQFLFPRIDADNLGIFEITARSNIWPTRSLVLRMLKNRKQLNASLATSTNIAQSFTLTSQEWRTIENATTFREPGILFLKQIQPTSVLLRYHVNKDCSPSRCGTIAQLLFRYSLNKQSMEIDRTYGAMMTKYPPNWDVNQVDLLTTKQKKRNSVRLSSEFNVTNRKIKHLTPNSKYNYQFLILYNTNILYLLKNNTFQTPVGLPGPPDPPRIVPKVVGSGMFVIEWTEPSNTGGVPIQAYYLQYKVESPSESEMANNSWLQIRLNGTLDQMNNSYVLKTDGKCYNCKIIVRVAATNSKGSGKYSKIASAINSGNSYSLNKALISFVTVLAGIALLILSILIVYCYRKKLKLARKELKFQLPPIVLPKDLACLPQITSDQTKICEKLGEGNFGTVYAGIAFGLSPGIGKARTVALKMLKEDATLDQRNEIVKEALTMRNLHHPNVLGLLGLCSEDNSFFLVLEFMDSGDLAQYLKKLRPQGSIPSQVNLMDLVKIVKQVADGAEYLEVMGYTHRDLAARNILVNGRDPEQCEIKIADFGLTRGLYEKQYYRLNEHSLVPIRWTAPEVFENQFFDSKSDTWAFGIVVWEIVSLAETPYHQLTETEVLQFVQSGGTEVPPENCGSQITQILLECWECDSIKRKPLSEITSQITDFIDTKDNTEVTEQLEWSAPFQPKLLPLRITTTSQAAPASNLTPKQHHYTAAGCTAGMPLQQIPPETAIHQNSISLSHFDISNPAECTMDGSR